MFSKFAFKVAVVGGLFGLLTGLAACSLRTGDPPKNNETGRLNNKYTCVHNVGSTINSYLDGALTEPEVKLFVTCLKNALNEFEYRSLKSEQQGFRPQQIADFLNQEFWNDSPNKMTPSFVKEIMAVKVLMFGGAEEFIRRAEYRALVDFLDLVGEEAVKNLPYMKLYRLKATDSDYAKVEPGELNAAKRQLKESAQKLADYLGRSGRGYHLSSFENLVKEARQFLSWDEYNENITHVEDLREFLSRFKEIAVGTNGDLIRANEWDALLDSAAQIYGSYLDFEYNIRGQNALYGVGLENFIRLAEQIFNLLESFVERHRGNGYVIPFESIDGMLDVLEKLDLLPLNIRAESLKPALRYTIENVLRSRDTPIRNGSVQGLSSAALIQAKLEFTDWRDSQRYLNELAEEELSRQGVLDRDSVPFYTALLKGFDFSQIVPDLPGKPGALAIRYLMDRVPALFRVDDPRIWIVPKYEQELFEVRHGLDNLGRLNVIRSVVRLLIRGFASPELAGNLDVNPDATGVTAEQMERFYAEARSLGEDLRFMDPRKENVGRRIFNEGNIFTYSGDGRDLLDFTETIELISFMWSGGLIRDALHARFSKFCQEKTKEVPENDMLGLVKIDRDCFFEHLGDALAATNINSPGDDGEGFFEFSNLPYMRAYLNRLSPVERSKFFTNLQMLARTPTHKEDHPDACYDLKHIELAEIATIATVLHYIETIFTTYDANMSGVLNEFEVMRAFPRFQRFLDEKIPGEQSVRTLKSAFLHLVQHKEVPEWFDKLGVYARGLINWYSNDPFELDEDLPAIKLDRAGMLEILVLLNDYEHKKDFKAAREKKLLPFCH